MKLSEGRDPAPSRTRLLHDVSQLLDRVAGMEVLVLGDAVLDVWSYGHARRLGREGAVPLVEVDEEEQSPGGAANLAANAAALGAQVRFAGIVGRDQTGEALLEGLRSRGVDVALTVQDRTRSTVSKHRVVCDGTVTARLDRNARGRWSEAARLELVRRIREEIASMELVLVADYGTGTLDREVRDAIAAARHRLSGPLVIDGHCFAEWSACRPTAVTPNADEMEQLLGRRLPASDRVRAVAKRGPQLLQRAGAEMVLGTLDRDGSVLVRRDHPPYSTTGASAPPQHTCGAGDAVTAAFALGLAAELTPPGAADLAAAAAASVVDRPGTCCCSSAGLVRQLADVLSAGVLTQSQVQLLASAHRDAGGRIVFTNGCFDVLHLGHVRYLEEARACGDLLVVGVNSDASVGRLKGPGRPVVTDTERASLVAALSCVNAVTIFTQDSPTALIEALRPDVYVKGGDYTASMLPEAELVERLGGRVSTVGYLADHSTTELLHRIQLDPASSSQGV